MLPDKPDRELVEFVKEWSKDFDYDVETRRIGQTLDWLESQPAWTVQEKGRSVEAFSIP